MKAAVIEKVGSVAVRDIDEPVIQSDEVLVRVRASGICGTDVHILHGGFIATYPNIPGHEFAGEIADVGSEVSAFKKGDRVVIDPNIYCGICPACKKNHQNQCYNLQAYGVTRPGGFEEYVAVKEKNLHHLSDNISFEEAAFGEPLACVVLGVERVRPQLGDTAVVFGAGPIGLLMAQMLRRAGVSDQVIVDVSRRRLGIADSLGVGKTLVSDEHLDTRLKQIAPAGFDIVVDCTGRPDVVQKGFGYTARGGKVLLFGVNPKDARVEISPYDVYLRDIEIIGTFSLRHTMVAALNMIGSGSVQVKPLLSHRLSLDDFAKGIRLIGRDETMKVQVQF